MGTQGQVCSERSRKLRRAEKRKAVGIDDPFPDTPDPKRTIIYPCPPDVSSARAHAESHDAAPGRRSIAIGALGSDGVSGRTAREKRPGSAKQVGTYGLRSAPGIERRGGHGRREVQKRHGQKQSRRRNHRRSPSIRDRPHSRNPSARHRSTDRKACRFIIVRVLRRPLKGRLYRSLGQRPRLAGAVPMYAEGVLQPTRKEYVEASLQGACSGNPTRPGASPQTTVALPCWGVFHAILE